MLVLASPAVVDLVLDEHSTTIAELVEEAASFATRGSNCSIDFRCDPDLWPADIDTGQIVQVVDMLQAAGRLDCLKLLHFHIGSQITNIRAVKDALREAGRIFVELHALGAKMRYLDCGGGLGVDYDWKYIEARSTGRLELEE